MLFLCSIPQKRNSNFIYSLLNLHAFIFVYLSYFFISYYIVNVVLCTILHCLHLFMYLPLSLLFILSCTSEHPSRITFFLPEWHPSEFLLIAKSLCFYLVLEMYIFILCPHSWKIFFTKNRIIDYQLFSFNPWSMLMYCHLASIAATEKSVVSLPFLW